jgi:hypothetical protein
MSRPQLRKEPITLGDIKEYLQTTDDFQLEVEVFRACLTAGFTAEHGGSYPDRSSTLRRWMSIFEDGD